jgi:hypothetical protein
MRSPPALVSSTAVSGKREMSISRDGRSTSSYQIDQIGAAGDEFRARIGGDLAQRVGDVGGARILEIDHDCPTCRPIACAIAATMFG